MREVIDGETQKRLWRAVAKGAAPDWNKMFEGYASCIDWPSALAHSIYIRLPGYRGETLHFPQVAYGSGKCSGGKLESYD